MLQKQTAFHKWYCENLDIALKISDADPSFAFNQDIAFSECSNKKIGKSYYEDICVKKNEFAKKTFNRKLSANSPQIKSVSNTSMKNLIMLKNYPIGCAVIKRDPKNSLTLSYVYRKKRRKKQYFV